MQDEIMCLYRVFSILVLATGMGRPRLWEFGARDEQMRAMLTSFEVYTVVEPGVRCTTYIGNMMPMTHACNAHSYSALCTSRLMLANTSLTVSAEENGRDNNWPRSEVAAVSL